MGQYSNKGLYNAYKKNNKEREALDYYATPTDEVFNILKELDYSFHGKTILEPCVGGGHMAMGIEEYLKHKKETPWRLVGTDIKDRDFVSSNWDLYYGLDFLADDYPVESADIVIMNPPYSILEPFMIRALEIAKHKLIVLGRTQALEGVGRYNNIYKDNPPTDIYQYIDRIQCWRNGEEPEGSSAQAYCWMVWDKDKDTKDTQFHWIHRIDN